MRLALLVSLALTAPTLAQDVWVVDENGGGDFLEIQDAVDAADQRDTILVRTGFYGTFFIANKSLQIMADAGAQVQFSSLSYAQIEALPHGRDVLVSGLGIRFKLGSAPGAPQGGGVLIQDCVGGSGGEAGVYVRHAFASLAIVDSQFEGADYGGTWAPYLDGGDGLYKADSFTHIAAYYSSFRAGNGGDGQLLACDGAGDGGDGAHIRGGKFVRQGVGLTPGQGGYGCPDGEDGEALVVAGSGTTSGVSTPASRLELPALLREGESYEVRVSGPAGSFASLIASDEFQSRDLGPNIGVLACESPISVVPLGVIPPNGQLVVPLTAPQTAPGEDSRRWFYQGMIVQSGSRFLTNPRALVVVDDTL